MPSYIPYRVMVSKHDFSLQIKAFHTIPSNKIFFNFIPAPMLWGGGWMHGFTLEIRIFYEINNNFTLQE